MSEGGNWNDPAQGAAPPHGVPPPHGAPPPAAVPVPTPRGQPAGPGRRFECAHTQWGLAAVSLVMILGLFGYLAWVGVGIRVACDDTQCELTRRHLFSGTTSETFRIDEVKAIDDNIDIVRSNSQIYSSNDPRIELQSGEVVRWYPKRVDPNFLLVEPDQLRAHIAGRGDPPGAC